MPKRRNFDHPADTVDERMTRKRANDIKTNANTAREYGYDNIGRDLDNVAKDLHKQVDDMANKRRPKG